MIALRFSILWLTIAIVSGCAAHRHQPPQGETLSKAMGKASSEHQGNRKIESKYPPLFPESGYHRPAPTEPHTRATAATMPPSVPIEVEKTAPAKNFRRHDKMFIGEYSS